MREELTRLSAAIFYSIIGLLIVLISISCGGGGGGGSAPATTTHVPAISNLQYSPQTATQNQSDASVSVTGTINFTDQGGDIATLTINKYDSTGNLLFTDTIPVQNISGVVSGSIRITGSIDTARVANYIFEVYVTDLIGNISNKLSGPFSVTAPSSPSEALIGNFRFVYKIISTWTDRVTMNEKSNQKSSEGTYYYTGYNADYPSVTASLGAWFPSLSKYLIVTGRTYGSTFFDGYVFSINTDNTLSGCYMLSSNSGATWSNCYSFIIPTSRKTSLGSWDMSMKSQSDPMDINEVIEKKMTEDQEVQAQRNESFSPVDGNLVSKIDELKTMIENLWSLR